MKTTIDLSDPLFNAAKALAQQSHTTMRALIEEGLRRVIRDSQAPTQPSFKLQDASVKGGVMLITDPHHWQQLEEDHTIARVTQAVPQALT